MCLFIGAHLFITVRLVRLCMYVCVCVLSNKFQLIYYYATALIMIDNDWMANSDMTL